MALLLQLPFSVVASLNGVHMFCKSQNVMLQSTSTEDTTYVWEEFEGRYILCRLNLKNQG